ncbi:GNAT family N-acetyltransferase [Micrococcus sp. KT16]|uniref:GNAT family N-acetyltransferase n=1 Tax=Micrococcus sp. KT16 TaxID=2184005 RepID=UPI001F3510BF|nr:GNAT family N-acetyltransferase [Micrococcus sp. KT16]
MPGLLAGLPTAVAVHGRHTLALKRIQAACERARPAGRHWYLEEVGTVPSARGRGAASALVRHGQRRASGLPVHLEASVPATVPFYERLGFRATGHVPVPGGEPLTCLRWEA